LHIAVSEEQLPRLHFPNGFDPIDADDLGPAA
jgi:hypothetical protein